MKLPFRLSPATRTARRMGDAARDQGDWPAAARHYRAHLALPQHAEDAPIWVQLGHAYKESGERDLALDAYERAVALAPTDADTHLQRAHCLKLLGRPGSALDAYDEALRRDPAIQNGQRDRDDLARAIKRSSNPELVPQPLADRLAQADAARDAGDWTQAKAHYEDYLADPRNAEHGPIWIQLGHAQKESGHTDDALGSYRRALALSPADADAHLQFGHVLALMGSQEEARAAYRRAIDLAPDSQDAYEALRRLAPNRDEAGVAGAPLPDEAINHDVAFPAVSMLLARRFA
jgi:tetratricopeptide (TPR) repeat protein